VGDEPYVLVGYSVGGVLASDVAERLADRGPAPEGVVLLDTFDPAATPEQAFAWAMGAILELDHDFLAIDDEGVAAMARYMRLLNERPESQPAMRGLLVRASASAQLPWPSWNVIDDSVEVETDHFSMLDSDADATAAAVSRWLGALIEEASGVPADAR